MQPGEREDVRPFFASTIGELFAGLPRSNNDALSRRDMGLEFLDVTAQVHIERLQSNSIRGQRQEELYRITNNSSSIVDTHLLMIARGLLDRTEMENASSIVSNHDPYLRVFLPNGVLLPGQSTSSGVALQASGQRSAGELRPHAPFWTGNP